MREFILMSHPLGSRNRILRNPLAAA